ncbi:MAG: histidine ammonia-lyase [Candidatus Kapabacteria bacterium]|nr:histidine ammonia-lyase [Candidatus Kapabacteria bacterium]MDW8225671.1 histidine ammonia-lyase [Bacteroidota bacterium]
MPLLRVDGHSLRIENLWRAVTELGWHAELAPDARTRMERSRSWVERWIESGSPVYGITTGFGDLASIVISPHKARELQYNLVRSHSVGAAEWLPSEIVRAILLLRANVLASGYTGTRPCVAELLLELFNRRLIPAIPRQGSVGASGDLVPLAHVALALIGEGCFRTETGIEPAAAVLAHHGLRPLQLEPKEGLSLINGTQMTTAYGALAVYRARQYAVLADVSAALSSDVLRASSNSYDERLHRLRPFPGQQQTAARLRALRAGSALASVPPPHSLPQDAYSLSCVPQIHGASHDAITYVWDIFQTELNAVTDNPLIDPDTGEHLEGGNFHGQPLAIALDLLSIACAELASVAERRIERLLNSRSSGLPAFLATQPGLHSGLMIAQYTAASIVSENKVLCHPASVDSIPTSAGQEDHNSMSSIAAQKAWQVVDNLQTVLAIELLCATQALEFLRPVQTSPPLERVVACIRERVPPLQQDRPLYHDIQSIRELIASEALAKAAFPEFD